MRTPAETFDLTDRVAIVTGASAGLGAGIARALASAGARVAVVARRRDLLAELADDIKGLAVDADLLDMAAVDTVVPRVVDGLGAPEILVNTAGNIFAQVKAQDEPLDDAVRTLTLNLLAPFRLSQQVYPHMAARGGGAIVHVSSISGQVGIPSIPQASYAASKAGLSGLTVELAVQWGRDCVRVNTLAPGFFRSEITESLFDSDKGQAWLRRNTPLPYDATIEDFLGAVLWLVSDAGRFVTGQTIVVDGGWTAR